jgi:serine/threonine-protein kinase
MIEAGKDFGHFLIKKEIGKGGMGTIFHAVDTMLNREVALKIIHPQLTNDAQLMERFKIEAMTQAQMNHPNIVMIFSFNKIDGDFVIAMEYVKGKSLKELLLERRQLTIQETIHYVKQILKGLQYAHSRNTIHRDIKPANVMVTEDNQVKLSDFGIAKIFGKQGLTKTGMLIGTPWYTSPEQILGHEIDFRSDLYSVGITFYEMVTGKVPFDSETNSDFQIQKAHLETPPPRPSIFNPEIGMSLERFIMKGLAKDPNKRFQSAVQMIEEMEKLEQDVIRTAILSKTELSQKGFQKKIDKKKSPVVWVASFIGVLMIAFALVFFLNREQKKTEEAEILKDSAIVGQKVDETIPDEDSKDELPQNNIGSDSVSKTEEIQKTDIQPNESDIQPDQKQHLTEKSNQEPEQNVSTQNDTAKEKPKEQVTTTEKSKKPEKQDKKQEPAKAETTSPDYNLEINNIKTLLKNRKFQDAEILSDELLKTIKSPDLFSITGTIKFYLMKFDEAEKYWSLAIASNSAVNLFFLRIDSSSDRTDSGQLIFKKNYLIFDCSTDPKLSFAVNTGKSQIAAKRIINSKGFEVKTRINNKERTDVFTIPTPSGRLQKEIFVIGFINKYLVEAK